MRLFTWAAATLVFTAAAFSQQPLQCVNPENVNGLVFLGRNDLKVTVTRGLPASMSGFHAPSDFSLIGTGTFEGTTKVAYKTALSSIKAFAALLPALGAEGWAIEPTPGSANTFNVAGGTKDGVVCRNGERRAVLVAEFADSSYAYIYNFPQARRRDCNAPDPAMQFPFGSNAAPRFQFPAGTSLAPGGGGGSSDAFTTSWRITSTEIQGKLVEHLAGQMMDQGWQPDAAWSGIRSAGSTWRKTSDGQPAVGTLVLVRVSEGTYDMDFTVTQ